VNAPLNIQDAAPRIPPTLSGTVAYTLRRAQEASFEAYLQRVGNPDLKPGRYSLLMVLDANPGLTPTALAKIAGRDKSTMTSALRDLAARGCVSRLHSAEDRRSYCIELTKRGRDLLRELRRHALAHDAVVDRIVGDDRAHLMAVLDRLVHALGVEGET
jgi:DNA-binding MarR family transcriptional regulator